jgi:hypothetical protein
VHVATPQQAESFSLGPLQFPKGICFLRSKNLCGNYVKEHYYQVRWNEMAGVGLKKGKGRRKEGWGVTVNNQAMWDCGCGLN